MTEYNKLYQIKGLSKKYRAQGQIFSRDISYVTALENINCDIEKDSIFGIVGESGSGKSTLIRMMMGAEKPSSGSIVYNDYLKIDSAKKEEIDLYQSKVKMIFQDPARSLNHRLSIQSILLGSLWYSKAFHIECMEKGYDGTKAKKALALDRIIHVLRMVGLDENILGRYPTEFSGGQRQRLAIVRALIHRPEVLICDEITSALDASTRRTIIDLLLEFKEKYKTTIIFIAHDLSLVLYLCDKVMVMSMGRVEELSDAQEIFSNPQSKETRRLLEALPKFPAKY